MNTRRQAILQETVKRYIKTAEPVGSKVLSDCMTLGVSSATIRNELKALEDTGHLSQVHTSSGRIPTDLGYRTYVNALMTPKHISEAALAEYRREFRSVGQNLEKMLMTVSSILTRTMNYTTIVLAPNIYQMILQMIHFVLIDFDKILVVLLSKAGKNREFVLRIKEKVDQSELNRLSKFMTEKLNGRSIFEIDIEVLRALKSEFPKYQCVLDSLQKEVNKLSESHGNEQLITKGFSKMISLPEFKNIEMTKKVLTELEESRFLVRLLREYAKDVRNDVVIGHEMKNKQLSECSLVVAPVEGGQSSSSVLAILGPKRMHYAYVIPLLRRISTMIKACVEENRTKNE